MKLLSGEQQDEILKRITACQIICNNYIDDIDAVTYMTENLADVALEVGGINGATKVINTMHQYNKKEKKRK